MKTETLLHDFEHLDISNFPDFHNFDKPLEMGLWVLWVAKEEMGINKLTALQIALIIKDVYEVSIKTRALVNSFNKSKGKKVHTHKENGVTTYEIMKAGKDHLKPNEEDVIVHYFEPNNKFKSKRILAEDILSNLKGDLKIIDPYCDKKTLDVLESSGKSKIQILTKINNISDARKQRSFLRELQDFKQDYPNVEFRDYSKNDIHDRYVISDDAFIIIGYSIKDFGKKETFITIFKNNMDIYNQLVGNFDVKWKNSKSL